MCTEGSHFVHNSNDEIGCKNTPSRVNKAFNGQLLECKTNGKSNQKLVFPR